MPESRLAKLGNWIHLRRSPCIPMPEISRVAFLRRVFYFPESIRMPAIRVGEFDWRKKIAHSRS
jgi:hypothetical protein